MLVPGCTGEESTIYACSYEQRKTDGCDGQGFEAWVSECFEFDTEDYNITASEVCGNVTNAGLFCQAGCCIDYEYRSVDLSRGTCSQGSGSTSAGSASHLSCRKKSAGDDSPALEVHRTSTFDLPATAATAATAAACALFGFVDLDGATVQIGAVEGFHSRASGVC